MTKESKTRCVKTKEFLRICANSKRGSVCDLTFRAGGSYPAMQAGAAAIAGVALCPICTLTGLCTGRPVAVRHAL